MAKNIVGSVGVILGFGLLLAACSGASEPGGAHAGTGGMSGTAADSGTGGTAAISGSGGKNATTTCVAGSKRCDGLNVKVCVAGSQETVSQTCPQACLNGACVASVCVPNSKFCKDGAVWKCDSNGAGTPEQQCAVGLFCREEADSASCSAQACAPSQPVCNGPVASVCTSDGSGPSSGGMDCSKTKRACYSGQCLDIACTNGAKTCQHGDVYVCAHNGTDLSLLTDCRAGEVCDADMGSCRAQLCDPGKVSCDGTRIQTCNAFGSAWLPGAVDCAPDGKICVSGSCRKQICGASRSYCQDDSVYSCDASGTTATLTQTCNPQKEHCETYSSGSFGYCKANDCHAGEKVCADNTIKVCNDDGSLPASGTPCAAAQYCENAACKDLGCVPGTYFCKGADVYYCDFNGPYLSEQCIADSACKALGSSGASCLPRACTPSSKACLGNQIGSCASDGQSLSAVTSDCTATADVCTAELTCAKSATDTLGVDDNVDVIGASSVVGDVIDVNSTRKLTELQTHLVLAGPRELRWIVYELVGQNFVAKVDKVVTNPAESGFLKSGPLSFQLVAGKRYLLAVVISGGDAVDYLDSIPFVGNPSFGTMIGRVLSYYPSNFDVFSMDSNYITHMKVTTELP